MVETKTHTIKLKEFEALKKDLARLGKGLTQSSHDVLENFGLSLIKDIKMRSPVGDRKDPGRYRDEWNELETRGFCDFAITNERPQSIIMEIGSPNPEDNPPHPWPNATYPEDPEGRTIEAHGKIWSKQTDGEPVASVAVETANWNQLYEDLFRSLFQEF